MSCSRCVLSNPNELEDRLVFMSYNVQNIFDDSDNGTEYTEFDPGRGEWGTSQYNTRLFNLSEVIRRAISGGPDIIALQEIENSRVAEDLVENYLKGMDYSHIIVTDTENSAIQLGFISRLEFDEIKVHQIFLDGTAVGRPILEVSIVTDGNTISIFNNHWKSKSGGEKETEPKRIAAASTLKRRILELSSYNPLAGIIILGDLNENWDEYTRIDGEYTTALMPLDNNVLPNLRGPILITGNEDEFNLSMESESIILYSPWGGNADLSGSYVYNDSWETIDHILMNSAMFDGSGFEYSSFHVLKDDYLLNTFGYPSKWRTQTGYGYSDHLPLILEITK